MKTYLSIDLDFWNDRPTNDCLEFMKKIKATGLPIRIVDDHADLLPFINKSGCDCIINLDYHSDISNNIKVSGKNFKSKKKKCSKEKHILPKLNCGTWANWVDNRNTYIWMHPFNVRFDLALCHEPKIDDYSPFCNPSVAGYKSVTKISLHNLPSWILNNVVDIGIACSYKWLEDHWEVDGDENHPIDAWELDSHPLSLVNVIHDVFGELPTNKEEFYFLLEPKDLSDKLVIEVN